MTHVVAQPCIKCKWAECAEVCPVEAFREGTNMLVIDPTVCIDCGACVPECPEEAIFDEDELPKKWEGFTVTNARMSTKLPAITDKLKVARKFITNKTVTLKYDVLPPGQYFISHSYQDTDMAKLLIRNLPDFVRPFVFQPIKTSPLEFVSNTLIGSILTCDALIYIKRKYSNLSFWVAFEREYALRSGKAVFQYEYKNQTIKPDKVPHEELELFFSAAVEDYPRLLELSKFMSEHRYLNLILPHNEMARRSEHEKVLNLFDASIIKSWKVKKRIRTSWIMEIVEEIYRKRIFKPGKGGNIVVFWSCHSLNSQYQQNDLSIAMEFVSGILKKTAKPLQTQMTDSIYKELNERILFVKLDKTPLPGWVTDAVQLYGDEERSELNRIDDLIVALYWRFVWQRDTSNRERIVAEKRSLRS